jgi:hypothetical protein
VNLSDNGHFYIVDKLKNQILEKKRRRLNNLVGIYRRDKKTPTLLLEHELTRYYEVLFSVRLVRSNEIGAGSLAIANFQRILYTALRAKYASFCKLLGERLITKRVRTIHFLKKLLP